MATGLIGDRMRVLGYVRVSTEEQAESGAGIEAQRAAILADADRRGWAVEFIEDAGFSAKSLKRPGLQLALERLRRGDASVLVVSKMDRLSRSLLDFAGIMQRAQREGWALVALDSPTDLTTPSGEAMASIMAVFAQLERRLIGERTKAGLAAKRAAGTLRGPIGRPRTMAAEVVERITSERAAGASLRKIAAGLNADGIATAQGGRQWHASTVRAVLAAR